MLSEQTLGVVGCGDIGMDVATTIRNGFGTRIQGCDIAPNNQSPAAKETLEKVWHFNDLDEMLPHCDYVCSVTPLTDTTYQMWNMSKFEKMKSSGVFINIGRGPSVNERDLALALKNKLSHLMRLYG